MAPISDRPETRWVLLLLLLLFGGGAAAPTPEALYRQARAAADRGDSAKIGEITDQALRRFSDSDDEWTWRIRTIRADYFTNIKDQPERARAVLRRPFPKLLRGTEVEVMRLQSLAFAGQRLRDPAAHALIEQAYVLAKAKHPQTLPKVLIYRMIVDPESTLKWAPEAVRYAQKYGQPDFEVRARGTYANYLASAERFDEAIGAWEPALERARRLPIRNEATEEKLEGNLGWGYLELGDYENAAEFFARAHATATRIGQSSDAIIWTYQLGNTRFRQGDLAGAEKQYQAAYALATAAKHRQRPIILALLAEHSLRVGRLTDAQRYCDESIRERRMAKDTEGELRSMTIAGGIAIAAGRLERTEQMLKGVLARTKSVPTQSEAHRRLAQLYTRQEKFAAADREFLQSIAKAQEARANVDAMERRFSYFNAVAELFESYVDFLIARGRDADALAATEMSRAQTLGDALPVTRPRDVRLVARENDATILCYWLGSARSYLWIVTPQKIDVVRLPPRQTIEAAIDAYQHNLLGARGSLTMSGAGGMELWQMLAAPAARFIRPQSRVIVVPHGRLAAFNVETLVVPTPKPHYWIEDVIVSTAGSLGLLARKEASRKAPSRILLVGNTPPPAREFAVLPRAGVEMTKVARHFIGRAVTLEGAKATPSAYRSRSPGTFTYLHFVAHGVPTRLKPLDSAVVLAREGDAFKLYAREIAEQPLTARLVTISSCHGAGTREYAGEGLVGLAWAFLRAGADNVVAALWQVNDQATPELMDRFYEKLAKGDDPATALRDAKLLLVRGRNVHANPLYWAPFTLYGSG